MDLLRRTTDGGEHWRAKRLGMLPQGQAYTAVEAPTKRAAWVVGEPGVYRTVNEGKTWRRVAKRMHPDRVYGGNWSRAALVSARSGWVMSDGGDVIHTSNGGKTWSRQLRATALTQSAAQSIVALDRKHALIPMNAVGGHYLLGTGYGGSGWRKLSETPFWWWSPDIAGVAATAPTTFWMGARTGEVFQSVTGGRTWIVLQASPESSRVLLIATAAAGRTVVVEGYNTSGHGAVLTTVAGSAWRAARMPRADLPPVGRIEMVDGHRGFALAGGWVLATVDGGQNWRVP